MPAASRIVGNDVDDVVELAALLPRRADPARPGDRESVAGPPEMRRHLLHPLKRRVECPGPADVVVVLASRRAEVGQVGEQPFGVLGQPVLKRRRAPGAVQRALGRCAVVTAHVDEQGVVPLSQLVDSVDDPPDLRVGVGQETGVDLHQAPGHRLVAVVIVGPRGDLLGARREPGAGGNDAHFDLAGIYPFPQRIPAVVELAGELIRPLRPDVVRTVRRAGREVDEERLVWSRRLLRPDPLDRLVGEILGEVVVVAADVRLDGGRLVVQCRFVLRGVAAQETVEAFEPEPRRPAVERPGRADLPGRGEVRLAEQSRCCSRSCRRICATVAVLCGMHTVVAGEPVGDLTDRAHVRAVVVAPGQQRRPRR